MAADFVANSPKAIADELSLLLQANEDPVAIEYGIQVGRRAGLNNKTFSICLFDPLPESSFAKYETIHDMVIPDPYRKVLNQINGAWMYRLVLFGLPPSMIAEPPLLDRSVVQPMDLATAHRDWRAKYEAEEDEFHFGSSDWTMEKTIGYFVSPTGSVRGLVASEGCVAQWSDFDLFLDEEVQRNKAAYPAYEKYIADALRLAEAKQKKKPE